MCWKTKKGKIFCCWICGRLPPLPISLSYVAAPATACSKPWQTLQWSGFGNIITSRVAWKAKAWMAGFWWTLGMLSYTSLLPKSGHTITSRSCGAPARCFCACSRNVTFVTASGAIFEFINLTDRFLPLPKCAQSRLESLLVSSSQELCPISPSVADASAQQRISSQFFPR